jgi:hypothetical protein
MITHHGWRSKVLLGFAAVAFSLVLATGAGAAPITADNVNEHIAAAKTAADHEAIASYFRGLAAEQGDRVKRHEAMLASYKKVGGKPYVNVIPHCEAIIAKSRELQQDYLEMAKLHDELAKGAAK